MHPSFRRIFKFVLSLPSRFNTRVKAQNETVFRSKMLYSWNFLCRILKLRKVSFSGGGKAFFKQANAVAALDSDCTVTLRIYHIRGCSGACKLLLILLGALWSPTLPIRLDGALPLLLARPPSRGGAKSPLDGIHIYKRLSLDQVWRGEYPQT
jgi:hypothetical protein